MKHLYAKMTFRIILISFLALMLIGCGESGSPGGSSGIGITSSINLSAGDTELPADGVSSTTITVSMMDSVNQAVLERTSVIFRTNLGMFRNGKNEYKVKTVDESGIVAVQLTADTMSGTAEVSVESNDVTQKIEVKFYDPHKVGTISLRTGSGSITADGTSQVSIIATVTDAQGNPEEGATVSFKTSLGQFSGISQLPGIINRTTSAVTDVDGEASVMLISGKTIGTASILASINGLNTTATVTFTADAPQTITVRAAPSTIRPTGNTTLFATLKDINGNPVEGKTVVFSQTVNSSEGELLTLSANTNLNGDAQATYTAGKEPGTDMIQAALASDLGMNAETAILVDPGAIVIQSIVVTAGAAELVADGLSKVKIRAIVTDVDGNPAVSKTVNFSTTAGTLSSQTTTTSDLGMAEVMLQSTTISGPVTIRGESDGFIAEDSVEFVPGPADHILMYAFPDTVPPGGPFQTAAIVQDKNDNRIDDQRLMLQVRRAGHPEIVDTAEMTPDQAEDGVFRFDWVAATAYGPGNLEVTGRVNNGTSKTVTVVVDETATIVGAISVIAGAQEIKADGTSSVLIRATVLDYNGVPAKGIVIDFATTLGTFSNTQKETDANGIADVLLKSGTNWGTATVTANANGFWGEVDVRFTSLKAGGVSLTSTPRVVAPGGQATLIAELRDANGSPVANEELYFDVFENNTLGSIGEDCSCTDCLTSTSVVAITDVNGRAIIHYCAGTYPTDIVGLCGCSGDRIRVTLASDSTVLDEVCICVAIPSGVAGYMTLTSDDTSLPADGISSTAVRVSVFDTVGFPMSEGTPITLTTNCGTFPGGVGAITLNTIDDSGTVITSLIASASPCVATVIATSGGLSQIHYIIFADEGDGVGSIVLTANPTSIPADGASSTAITAVITDNFGNPVPDGTPVTFITTLGTWEESAAETEILLATGGGSVTTALIAGTVDGVAFVTVTAGLKTQAIEVPIVEELTEGVTVISGASSLVADGASETTIRATVRDADGNTQAGVDVTFATTLGTVNGGVSDTATTNASGVAEVTLRSTTTTGMATITATANGFSDSVDVEFVAGAPGGLVLTAAPVIIGPNETSNLIATLTDLSGDPVVGETIAFVIAPNQSNATLSSVSAVTDINGQAFITYTAGSSNGDDTITARSISQSTITDFVEIVVGGQVSLVASDDPIIADGITTSTFTATVLNNAGSPVLGVPVIFKNVPSIGSSENTFNGSGINQTPRFNHPGGDLTIKMTHAGVGNFAVWLVNVNTGSFELIKNTIGVVTEEESLRNDLPTGEYYLEVTADGVWQFVISSLTPDTIFDELPALAIGITDAAGQVPYTYISTTTVKSVTIGIKAGSMLAEDTIQQIAGAVTNVEVFVSPNIVNPESNATVTARVTDANNNAVNGETVTFAFVTNLSGATIGASAVTDLSGEALVTYTAGSTDGVTDTLSGTANAISDTTTVSVDASAVMVGSLEVLAGAESMPADGSSQVVIRATVLDTNGNPVSDLGVNFVTTAGTILTALPVITDENGVAQAILESSSRSATATVTAYASGFRKSVDVEFLPTVPRAITLRAAPSTVNPGGVSTVTATLRDINNNRVPNETITFLLAQNNSGASISAVSAVTNINGQATITYTAGGTDLVTDRIRVRSVTDTSITEFVDIDVSASATIVGSVSVISGASSIPATGTSTTAIRATVVDIDGNPMSGFTVNFETTLGGLSAASAPTNQSGIAQVTLTSAANTGTAVVTAEASGFIDDVNVAFVGGSPDSMLLVAAPSTVNPGGGACNTSCCESTSILTVTLMDSDDNPLSGESIRFSFGTSNNSGASLSSLSAVTDINGQATVTYTAGNTVGTDRVTAHSVTDSSISESEDITVSVSAVVVGSISVTSGSSSLVANGTSETVIRAMVMDTCGNPLSVFTVNFATTLGEVDGAANATALTNASGMAEVTLTSASAPGTAVITAEASGLTAAVDVVFVGSVPFTLALTPVPDTVNPEGTAVLTARLIDSASNPLPGESIRFYFLDNQSGGSLSSPSAVTDINGDAIVTFTAGSANGTDQIIAISLTDSIVNDTMNILVEGGSSAVEVAAIGLIAAQSSLSPLDTTTITAMVYDSSGHGLANQSIVFILDDPTLGFITASGTTASDGTFVADFEARDITGSVNVTATSGSVSSAPLEITIKDQFVDNITLDVNPTAITVTNTATVSAHLTDGGVDVQSATVTFVLQDSAYGTITPSAVTNVGGVATATFTAANFAGTATIIATSGAVTETITLDIHPAEAASIEFNSVSQNPISIRGTGGQEFAIIQFDVKDVNGNPAEDVDVLITMVSGIQGAEYLEDDPFVTPYEQVVGTSGGIAEVTLHSGYEAGTVSITASITTGTSTISATTPIISIGGGVVTDDWFVVSCAEPGWNLGGLACVGVETQLTAWLADRFGNYNVLDGHTVSFQSEVGLAVDPIGITDGGTGAATTTIRTQGVPKDVVPETWEEDLKVELASVLPSSTNYAFGSSLSVGDPLPAGHPRDGVCNVLVFTIGEESFVDGSNGNLVDGVFNAGVGADEDFTDTVDDPWRDYDDDGLWDDGTTTTPDTTAGGVNPEEDEYQDRDANDVWDGVNGVWDGNKNLYRQVDFLITGLPYIRMDQGSFTVPNGGTDTVRILVCDQNYNPLSAGSTYTVSVSEGNIVGGVVNYEYPSSSFYGSETTTDWDVSGGPIDNDDYRMAHRAMLVNTVTIGDDDPADTDPPKPATLTVTVTWKSNGSCGDVVRSFSIAGTVD